MGHFVTLFLVTVTTSVSRASFISLNGKSVFTFVNDNVTFTVPSNVKTLQVFMWGAGGYGPSLDGGNGAYVEGTLTVTPGVDVTIIVGQGGSDSDSTTGTFGGGGMGGGGRSAVRINGADVVTAGGGGGGANGGHATSNANGVIETTSYRGGNDVMSTDCNGNNAGAGSGVASGCSTSAGIDSGMYQGGSALCEDGKSYFDGYCYWFNANYVNWHDARDDCFNNGGWLVDINSDEENDFVYDLSGGNVVWIGLNDEATEGEFEWAGGQTGTYRNWNGGEPNNGGVNGLIANSDGLKAKSKSKLGNKGRKNKTKTAADADARLLSHFGYGTYGGYGSYGGYGGYGYGYGGGDPEHCVEMQPGWNDLFCDSTNYFVCKKDMCTGDAGGGGGYFGGGAACSGAGGGGSSLLSTLIDYSNSGASLITNTCAGSNSIYFSDCASDCGSSGKNGCVVLVPIYETSAIAGDWCLDIGLFDSFGDGWGDETVLRIYDKNDASKFVDVSSVNSAFVAETVCVDSNLELRAEIVCVDCSLRESWEMYYTITESGKTKSKTYVGNHNTLMTMKRKSIKVEGDRDLYRSCDTECKGDSNRYADKVIDTTGNGWCSKSRSEVEIPEYDAITREVVSYSSLKLPEALTSPQYIISNFDRDEIVLRGSIKQSTHDGDHRGKNNGKSAYEALFCGKKRQLADGTYVFRVDGALSKDHAHKNTKWEFCGRRGTSDEELVFRMANKECTVISKQSRFELTGALQLLDFSGTLSMPYDEVATVEALSDVSYNEVFLEEIETTLHNSITALNEKAVAASVHSIVFANGAMNVVFGLRLNTADSVLMKAEESWDINVQLSSAQFKNVFLANLHQYPEFAAVSQVSISNVEYDEDFKIASQEGRQYDTVVEASHAVYNSIAVPYAMFALVGACVVVLFKTVYRN